MINLSLEWGYTKIALSYFFLFLLIMTLFHLPLMSIYTGIWMNSIQVDCKNGNYLFVLKMMLVFVNDHYIYPSPLCCNGK